MPRKKSGLPGCCRSTRVRPRTTNLVGSGVSALIAEVLTGGGTAASVQAAKGRARSRARARQGAFIGWQIVGVGRSRPAGATVGPAHRGKCTHHTPATRTEKENPPGRADFRGWSLFAYHQVPPGRDGSCGFGRAVAPRSRLTVGRFHRYRVTVRTTDGSTWTKSLRILRGTFFRQTWAVFI